MRFVGQNPLAVLPIRRFETVISAQAGIQTRLIPAKAGIQVGSLRGQRAGDLIRKWILYHKYTDHSFYLSGGGMEEVQISCEIVDQEGRETE